MAYFYLTILCFVLIHVQSVKVIQKDGNLVLKGITNWKEIKNEYMKNRKDFTAGTAIGAGSNNYDGGDIIVYPDDSEKATQILFNFNGKSTPYHYLHQNLNDCSFEFICVAWWSCLRGFSKMKLLPDVLINKIKNKEISFSPHKETSPVTAIVGLTMKRIPINYERSNVVFYDYDRSEFQKYPKMKEFAEKAVARVQDLWINIGSDNEDNANFVSYRTGGPAYFGKMSKIDGLELHQSNDDKARFSITEVDFLNECEKRRVAVGKNHDVFIHSYDGDYGLKASDQCVPFSKKAKLPPATAPDFELHAVKEGDEESHKLPPPIPVPLERAEVYNHNSAHNAYYDEYGDYLDELYDELEQFERSKAYRAGYDKGYSEETKRMNRLKYRLNQ